MTNVAVWPALTVWPCGCSVITGGTPLGGGEGGGGGGGGDGAGDGGGDGGDGCGGDGGGGDGSGVWTVTIAVAESTFVASSARRTQYLVVLVIAGVV